MKKFYGKRKTDAASFVGTFALVPYSFTSPGDFLLEGKEYIDKKYASSETALFALGLQLENHVEARGHFTYSRVLKTRGTKTLAYMY